MPSLTLGLLMGFPMSWVGFENGNDACPCRLFFLFFVCHMSKFRKSGVACDTPLVSLSHVSMSSVACQNIKNGYIALSGCKGQGPYCVSDLS